MDKNAHPGLPVLLAPESSVVCLRRYGGAFGTALDWEAQLMRAAG